MMTGDLTFGGDPEVFVVDKDGKPVPPIKLLPKCKEVISLGENGGMNRDGIAFELNPTAGTDPYAVSASIHALLQAGALKLAELGLSLVKSVEVTIGQGLPNDVYEFGCSPDFNAYTRAQNRVAVDAKTYLKRHAGGHITMGIPQKLVWEDVCELVKLFDAWAGLRSLQWSSAGSVERRKVYGAAGCFRWSEDKCIVEYRTPDNGWLWNNAYPTMCNYMEAAYFQFMAGVRVRKPKTIIHAINTCDWNLAKRMLYSL